MKKISLVLFFVLMVAFSAHAGYVRKLKEPDFFIPEQNKMHQQEKIPSIEGWNKPETKPKQEVFYEKPDYKKKYSEYIEDIKILSRVGNLPENKELESDLQAMDGTVFEVEESAETESFSKEKEKFEEISLEILQN